MQTSLAALTSPLKLVLELVMLSLIIWLKSTLESEDGSLVIIIVVSITFSFYGVERLAHAQPPNCKTRGSVFFWPQLTRMVCVVIPGIQNSCGHSSRGHSAYFPCKIIFFANVILCCTDGTRLF
mgnify:CR=1 FL=1